ncbi:MAG: PKD domain-containing protein [Bacteroidota bacterium]
MKYFLLILTFLIATLNLVSQVKQPVFHPKNNIVISEDEKHKRAHFLDDFFSNKSQLRFLIPAFKDILIEQKAKYGNSAISFERAYSLVFREELRKIKEVALSSAEMSDNTLNELFRELYENTLSVLSNSATVKLLDDRDVELMDQYYDHTGYSNKVTAACTNVDFADGTTNGWQCSWGTGSGNQISAVVGYSNQPVYFCNPGTGTYYANNIFISANQCCTGSFLGVPNGCTNAASTMSTVPVTAIVNNPAVTGTANSGPINSSANSGGAGVHTIMTGGTDPNCPISVVPPTGGNSIRLGNSNVNLYKAQRLRQTFTVGAGNPNFVYQYAVVIQDPGSGHTLSDQPYFKIRMYDQSNNLIDCATYDVDALSAPSIGGFQSSGDVLYKNWSTVTVPLLSYVGQNVTIEFTTSDCALGGHYGYAYIQCLCAPIPITSSLPVVCNGQTTVLTAPPGAATYAWVGPGIVSGASTQTAVVNVGGSYTVNMTTFYSPPQTPCNYSQSVAIGSAPAPASSSFTMASICLGAPVTFTNNSSGGGIFEYIWDYGDGSPTFTTATLTNPVHTYTTAGNYSVSLVANNGCPQPFSLPLSIKPQPNADFNLNNSCMGVASNFTNTSTAPAPANFLSNNWNFGDGSSSSNIGNSSHTYTAANTYSVSLLVINDQQCRDSVTKTIIISPNPVMAIGSNTVCLNLTTAFTNSSTVAAPDNIATWAWDFDNNGSTDNGAQSPTNTFTTVGTHTVELKATTNNGCRDSTTIPVLVNAIQTANFTASNACLNSAINIVNSTTVAPPDFITAYNWDFGVGANPSTGTGFNPVLPSYNLSGTKTITLNISSNTTCTANLVQSIQIYAQPVANFSTTSVCQSTATAFTDLSTPSGSIIAWSWDFTNNGSTDNTTNAPTPIYSASGTFSASLIIRDNNSCKDTVVLPLNVWGHAIPDFTPTSACVGNANTFSNTTNTTTNLNVGGTPVWSWDFADGSPVNASQDPTHTYTTGATGATFNVTLTATTTNGCVDNVVKAVKVNALPTATFTPMNACVNSNVILNNASTIALPDNVTTYAWNFGVGSSPTPTSSIQNPPILKYNSSGIKTITLTIFANTTCSASITQTVEVYPQPVANFSATSVCQSTATTYTDLSSTPTGTITGWQWDFTNNNSIDNSTSSPTNLFVSSGTFTTSLIVTNMNGCKDTVALPVDVWGHTIPDFSPDKVCFGTANTFTNLTNETTNPNVGVGTTYVWDFADGSTSGLPNPNHTYSQGGNSNAIHNVTLTATSVNNCVDTKVKAVNVYAVPTASFTSDSVCLGSASHMMDASNGNGNIVNTYAWDFSSNGTVDVLGVANPNFVFPSYGSNTLSYTVSTSPVVGLVCSNLTSSITVWVNPNPVPDFTFVNNCINAQPNTFDGSSSIIAVGSNTAYAWAFGDGSIATPTSSAIATHNYALAGVYNTTLIVTSNKGCQGVVSKQVAVYEKPYMKIASSRTCDQSAMTFTAISLPNSGNVTNWFWDFNNSISTFEGAGQTTNFTFGSPGSQTVALIAVTSPGGCKDTIIKAVYVNYNPVAIFSGDKLSGCPIPLHCVNFTDASPTITGPAQISQWQWTLGDGTTLNNPTSAMVNHCYGNSSSSQLSFFSVSLVVTTDSGCVSPINNKSNYITVYPTPIADYTVNPNPGSILTPLEYFTNQSVDYSKWWWTFGDGGFKTDSVNVDPSHFYSDESAATYFSNLIVMNAYGCSDTAYVRVEIQPDFTFYIPNAFSPANSDNINDVFTGKGIGIDKFEMWIYDRWGERVFYTDDIVKGWDGKVQGKGGEEKQDVYIWKVKLTDVLGKKHDYIGHVTLLR